MAPPPPAPAQTVYRAEPGQASVAAPAGQARDAAASATPCIPEYTLPALAAWLAGSLDPPRDCDLAVTLEAICKAFKVKDTRVIPEKTSLLNVAKRSVFVADKAGNVIHSEVKRDPASMPNFAKIKKAVEA